MLLIDVGLASHFVSSFFRARAPWNGGTMKLSHPTNCRGIV